MSDVTANPGEASAAVGPANLSAAERYPNLDATLRSRDGFAKSVMQPDRTNMVLTLIGIVAVLLIAYNAVRASRITWAHTAPSFFDVHLRDGSLSPLLVILVYVPLVAVIAVVAAFAVGRATRAARLNRLYDRFCASGFLTLLIQTAITIKINDKPCTVFLFGQPGVPTEWVRAAARQVHDTAITNPPTREASLYAGSLAKLTRGEVGDWGMEYAYELREVDSRVPAGIYLMAQKTVNTDPRVAIPLGKNTSKLGLYRLAGGISLN